MNITRASGGWPSCVSGAFEGGVLRGITIRYCSLLEEMLFLAFTPLTISIGR
jgi:hypothetical protein